jgi:predicted DNA-binding WGR domain protein
MRRFEYVEGTSSKFWSVHQEESNLQIRWGKIGTDGQTQEKSFASPEKATAELNKLVAEKTKKGYAEVGVAEGGVADASADAPVAPAADAPAAPKAPKAPPKPKAPPAPPPSSDGWMAVDGGYAVQIRDGALVARNAAGKELASLPKGVKDSDAGERLRDAAELLAAHAATCRETVETWMLRSLTVPYRVLEAVWADPDWQAPLRDLVVQADGVEGLLRGLDERGMGVVDLDGESRWIKPNTVAIPHPILLAELDEWRALATSLGATQATPQLFRETFARPELHAEGATTVSEYAGGNFPMLGIISNEARKRGYRISGGCAVCRVWSTDGLVEARYDVGDGDPSVDTVTGDLYWVNAKQHTIPLSSVGPVPWSEGHRMAAALFAKRTIEKESDDV